MSEQRALFLEKSLIGTCALVALVLLVSFYSVVHGAVDRAARHRLAATADAVVHAAAPTPQHGSVANASALVARVGN